MARKKKKKGKSKLKTHKATSKRFKMTGSGKIVRTKGNQGHLQRRKSKRAQRLTAEMIEVPVAKTRKNIERLVPYMKKNRK